MHSVLFGVNLRGKAGLVSSHRHTFLELITPVFYPRTHPDFYTQYVFIKEAAFLNFYPHSLVFVDIIKIVPAENFPT
jgi:hypothetical protein